MKNSGLDYKVPLLPLIAVFLFLGCILGYAFLSKFDPFFDEHCRDDLLAKVPVYPTSTLIRNDESESTSRYGSSRQLYQTSDSPEDIANFYDGFQPCWGLTYPEPDGTIVCDGNPEGDSRMTYFVEIRRQDAATLYSLAIVWHCGFLDD